MQTVPSPSSNPPFLLTYWNPFNEKAPGLGQSFLNYVKDVSLANYTANLVGTHIDNASREQISVLQEGFGFLDQRLIGIRQEQINTNILLENIGLLLKLPDSEKQRQLHIERGLKFSTQSLKDEDIAIDAKNEFYEALKLMPQDWFVLQQLAVLLLYNQKILDISLAKVYFLKAAKYANADSQTEELTFINSLFHQNLSSPFENKDNSTNGLKVFVREAYLNAALAAYILADFEEAVNISKKAVSVNPEDPKSLFFTAKYLARNNNKKEALEYLKKAIINAPYLCFATSEDGDLKAIPQALDFCNKFSIDFSIKIRAINIKIDELKYFINNSIVFELKKEIDEKNYLIKGCELLQMPLIDLHAEYHGKDPLFNKALQFLVNDLMSDDANSLPTVPKDEEGRRVYPVFDSWDRQKEVLNQMDYSYLAFYDELTDNAARETAIKEFFDDNLQLKLDGYFVKDLYDKWDEIKRIFEQKVQIQKEKELRKIDQENRKLIQKKQEEELSKPILDYYKKKNFTEAWKEIKKVRTSYPTNQYFVSLEKMINDNISGKLLSCWICVFLITFFTIGISDAFLLDNSVYQSIIIKLPLWLYKVLVILLLFGTSITLATYMTIKRSKIIRSTKD